VGRICGRKSWAGWVKFSFSLSLTETNFTQPPRFEEPGERRAFQARRGK